MAQDRTGPGFGPNQDPYEVERREIAAAERNERLNQAFIEGFRKGAVAPDGLKAIARLALRQQPGA